MPFFIQFSLQGGDIGPGPVQTPSDDFVVVLVSNEKLLVFLMYYSHKRKNNLEELIDEIRVRWVLYVSILARLNTNEAKKKLFPGSDVMFLSTKVVVHRLGPCKNIIKPNNCLLLLEH